MRLLVRVEASDRGSFVFPCQLLVIPLLPRVEEEQVPMLNWSERIENSIFSYKRYKAV